MSNASVSRAADGAHALIAFASDVLAQIPETPLHGLPAMLAKAIKPVHAATRSINKTTSIALHHSPDGYESVSNRQELWIERAQATAFFRFF